MRKERFDLEEVPPPPPLQRKSLPSLHSPDAHKWSPVHDGLWLAPGSQKLHMGNSDTQTFTF